MAAKQKKREIVHNPFPPDTDLVIHEAAKVEVERNQNREPFGEPIAKAKTTDGGAFSVSGLKPGTYSAAGKVGVKPVNLNDATAGDRTVRERWDYVTFTVGKDG